MRRKVELPAERRSVDPARVRLGHSDWKDGDLGELPRGRCEFRNRSVVRDDRRRESRAPTDGRDRESLDEVEGTRRLWYERGMLREDGRESTSAGRDEGGSRRHVERVVHMHDLRPRQQVPERADESPWSRDRIGDIPLLRNHVIRWNAHDSNAFRILDERCASRPTAQHDYLVPTTGEAGRQRLDESLDPADARAVVGTYEQDPLRSPLRGKESRPRYPRISSGESWRSGIVRSARKNAPNTIWIPRPRTSQGVPSRRPGRGSPKPWLAHSIAIAASPASASEHE